MKNYKMARKMVVEMIGETGLKSAAKELGGIKAAVETVIMENVSNEYYADTIKKVLA